jgi:DNA-binding HxlR family transcriptional regulator
MTQTYGQHCGLAHAMELVGEPWAMLMIRDLLVEPKAMADMRKGLPQMPPETLSARLDELERAQVIRRREPLAAKESSFFELTEYGIELGEIVDQLCRWGLRTLGGVRRDDIMTIDGLVTALRVTFRPEAARGVHLSFVIEFGDMVAHACVSDGDAEIGKGHLLNPDLIIVAGPPLQLLLAGEMSPREALETGGIRLRAADGGPGNPGLLLWFVELFHIPPPPIHRSGDALVQALRPMTPTPADLPNRAIPVATAR